MSRDERYHGFVERWARANLPATSLAATDMSRPMGTTAAQVKVSFARKVLLRALIVDMDADVSSGSFSVVVRKNSGSAGGGLSLTHNHGDALHQYVLATSAVTLDPGDTLSCQISATGLPGSTTTINIEARVEIE